MACIFFVPEAKDLSNPQRTQVFFCAMPEGEGFPSQTRKERQCLLAVK